MFDFAFSELLVICVVALVVLGPTRLPGVVRKIGRWIGKARAMAHDFRQQLENEVTLEELNRMTEKQSRAHAEASSAATPEPDAPPAPGAESAATDGTTPDATTADTAHAGTDSLASSGYPYGAPADAGTTSSSSGSADPSVVADPNDDTFSHAHAAGEAPAPWTPEPETPASGEIPGNASTSPDTRSA